MKFAKTFALLASASATALAMPAFAQEAQAADDSVSQADIVVTATRRSERLQDVPIAVSAVSGDQLAESGFKTLQDIQYQFSGVQFGTSPNDAGFRLRGVGTAGGFSSASEQNVGTVVDNVVIPFGNPITSLGDLERVEVLKGPQGTQFGKNASSGVVNVTTRKPVLGEFSGNAFASYAELNEHDVHGAVNVPLGSTAALNVFAFHREHDGFYRNVVRNEDWGAEKNYGVRAKLLWEASDKFSAYLIGDWSRYKRFGPGQFWTINAVPSFANPLMAARFGAVLALGITPGFNNNKSAEEYAGYGGEENYGASLELNYELGEHSLTSVTAYRRLNDKPNVFAIDATPFPIFTAQQTGVDQSFASEEIRLTSPKGGTIEYVGGVFLSRRRAGYGSTSSAQLRPALPFAPVQLSISAGLSTTTTQTESSALFADGSIRVSDTFKVLLGGRYSYDWVKAASFSIVDPAFPPFVGPNGFTVPYTPRALDSGSVSKGDWSGKFGLEYKPSRDLLFFATVARGYLGPTVTFSGLTGTRSNVDPQTVRDITIGMKSQLFDRQVTFNANVFFDTYKNLQTSVFNGLEFLTENAGGFKANGFEMDAAWKVSPRFALNGSFTYSDTKFTDYITACPNVVKAGLTCFISGTTSLLQAKGEPLSGAPKYSATFGMDFNHPLGDSLSVDASMNYYYRSKVQYDVGNAISYQPGYDTVGLNFGVGDIDHKWRVGVFARNLLDKRFHASVIGLPFSDPGGEVNWLTREGRRTVGVSAEMKF